MTLKIETRQADGVTIVSCQGRVMFGEEATALRDDLKRVLASSRQIVLNLAGVNYIDSGGLGSETNSPSTVMSKSGGRLCMPPMWPISVRCSSPAEAALHSIHREKGSPP